MKYRDSTLNTYRRKEKKKSQIYSFKFAAVLSCCILKSNCVQFNEILSNSKCNGPPIDTLKAEYLCCMFYSLKMKNCLHLTKSEWIKAVGQKSLKSATASTSCARCHTSCLAAQSGAVCQVHHRLHLNALPLLSSPPRQSTTAAKHCLIEMPSCSSSPQQFLFIGLQTPCRGKATHKLSSSVHKEATDSCIEERNVTLQSSRGLPRTTGT